MGFSITSAVLGGIIIIAYSVTIGNANRFQYYHDYNRSFGPYGYTTTVTYINQRYSYDAKMGLAAVILALGVIEFCTGLWVSICLCVLRPCCADLEVLKFSLGIDSESKSNGSPLAINLEQLLCCYSWMWRKIWLVWLIWSCGLSFSYLPTLPFFGLMEGCQQSFHALQKTNTLIITVPVHKTSLNVDDDHDDSAMTESIFVWKQWWWWWGYREATGMQKLLKQTSFFFFFFFSFLGTRTSG